MCIRAKFAMAAAVVNSNKQQMTNRTKGNSNKPPPGSIIWAISDDIADMATGIVYRIWYMVYIGST